MKNLFTFVLVLILASLSQGCRHRPERLEPYGWPLVDPEFDSLTRVAEQYMYTNIPLDSVERITRGMDSIARVSGRGKDSNELLARARFMKAYCLYMNYKFDEAREQLAIADSLSADAYTKRRIKSLKLTFDDYKSYETFCDLLKDLEWYGSINDLPQQGEIANVISTSLIYTDVPELALYYLDMADSLFMCSGQKLRTDNIRINKATLLCETNRTEEAEEVFGELISDIKKDGNTKYLELLYRNHYYFFGDSLSLFEAYSIRKGSQNESLPSLALTTLYESLIADYYIGRNILDSAATYIDKRAICLDSISDEDLQMTILEIDSKYYEAVGKTDLAESARKKYNEIVKAVNENQQPENKIYTDFMNAKRQIQAAADETESSLRRRIWILAGVSALTLFAIVLAGVRWRSRYKSRQKETKRRADKSEREMMGIAISRQHDQQTLSQVKNEITRLSKQAVVNGSDIAQLERTLLQHKLDGDGIRNFEETFKKIHPDFYSNLKSIAPDMSDAQIRLCEYIMLGLNNQEIASILNIKESSLRQARLRLRRKFGLTKEDSITKFLREITPPLTM